MTSRAAVDSSRAAAWFHALSDETRLAIVRRLAGGERCVCELTDLLGAAQSRLSFHLKALRTAGIVSGRREGRWMYYSLNPEVLEAAAAYLAELGTPAEEWRRNGSCCS